MSQIRKVGKFTYWCSICEKYLLNDTAEDHIKLHQMTGIERHWLEHEQGDAADRELMKLMGIRWP